MSNFSVFPNDNKSLLLPGRTGRCAAHESCQASLRGAGVANALGRRAAGPQSGLAKSKNEVGTVRVIKAASSVSVSALLFARVRERRPALYFCQKAALWCSCAGRALSQGHFPLWSLARQLRSSPWDPPTSADAHSRNHCIHPIYPLPQTRVSLSLLESTS